MELSKMPPRVVRPACEGEGADPPTEITPEFMQCLFDGLQTAMTAVMQTPPTRPTSAGVAPDQMRELIDAIGVVRTAAATPVLLCHLLSQQHQAWCFLLIPSTMNLPWASRSTSKANALYLRNGKSIQREQ